MQLILTLFTIVVVIVLLFYFGEFSINEWKGLQQGTPSENQENIPQKQSTGKQNFIKSTGAAAIVEPEQPAISINTYITSGPKEGEIIDETNRVAFEFKARVSPKETQNRVAFETKVEGFDNNWVSTSAEKRTVTLPPDTMEYTFLVRAKIKGVIDPTPAKRNFKINLSPYFGKVKISSVRIPTSSRPSLITLSTYLKKEEEISITGWNIKGRRGSFVIPQGIEKYRPSPFDNPVATDDIFIKQGDYIYLSTSSNPLGKGRDFRPNKCLGYVANYRDFPISISRNCPKPTREEISHLDPCCQEFILRLRSCEIPYHSGNLEISRDSECVSYLNKNFNYDGCFRNYSRDENFLLKNWHIYLNKDIVVGNDCDTLYLQDQNGLIVDKYSYGRPVCK